MKTHKNLFPKIVAFENLLLAAQKAAAGKREQDNVLHFFNRLEENLWRLQEELQTQIYQSGNYSTFRIYEPKPRMISAAPFHDRVVHHALINIIGPLFERSFIFDSYANRLGKGTHRAIRRYQHFLRDYRYVLKCDIKKYFPSIDHEILKALIRRRIADAQTLWLIDAIIDGSNPQEPVHDYFPGDDLLTPLERQKGLPIGFWWLKMCAASNGAGGCGRNPRRTILSNDWQAGKDMQRRRTHTVCCRRWGCSASFRFAFVCPAAVGEVCATPPLPRSICKSTSISNTAKL